MNVLVVDDKINERKAIVEILEYERHALIGSIYEAGSEKETLDILSNSIDIVFLDIWFFAKTEGLQLLIEIKKHNPLIEIIMVTSDGSPEIIRKVVDHDVYNYVKKPFKTDDILVAFEIARSLREKNLKKELQDAYIAKTNEAIDEIVGISPIMNSIKKSIRNAGRCKDITILIRGESGTGKELVARALHKEYGDPKRPFVAVNCGAISKELVESELFGHEQGAFTGAKDKKLGLFELADNGDIFLDEVAELPLESQAKLLRVLDGSGFRRVGGTVTMHPHFRIMCATNRNLENLVREGKFREDLYHRICVYELELPPLRERKEDIIPLTESIVTKISIRSHTPKKVCSEEVIDYFLNQSWPGNVRSLKNILEIMVINAEGKELQLRHLPGNKIERLEQKTLSTSGNDLSFDDACESLYEESLSRGVYDVIEHAEKYIMQKAIHNNKNFAQAATSLRTSRVNFHNKMKKYGLHEKNERILTKESSSK